MAFNAPQAQELLDKHQIDGKAIGGFVVSLRSPSAEGMDRPYWLLFILWIGGLIGVEGLVVAAVLVAAAALALWYRTDEKPIVVNEHRMVIVTNLGLAVTRTTFAGGPESNWEIRPEHEVRYELDPMEVRKGEDTVELTVGDRTHFAFGEDRDAAFRLYSRQPSRWSGLTDQPAPSR